MIAFSPTASFTHYQISDSIRDLRIVKVGKNFIKGEMGFLNDLKK